jgi:hypothetical protein
MIVSAYQRYVRRLVPRHPPVLLRPVILLPVRKYVDALHRSNAAMLTSTFEDMQEPHPEAR